MTPEPKNKRGFCFPVDASAWPPTFHACRRCRPDRLTQLLPAPDDEVVCGAVRLILAGELDHGNEDDLAARLGFSARHLRRLFNDVLGITPDGLARSARTQYARRLLDDTDLSVTEIAHATGFGSVRQLNRAVKEIFHTTPRDLRTKLRQKDRLVAGCGLVIRLRSLAELDWPAMAEQLAARAIPGVEAVDHQTYRRTIDVDGDPGVVEVFPRSTADSLVMCLHLPHWQDAVHLTANARRFIGVDPGRWDPFEAAVVELIAREVGPTAALEAVAELVKRYGTIVPGLSQLRLNRLFPTPVELAEAVYPDVPAGRSIHALATDIRDERIHLDEIAARTTDQHPHTVRAPLTSSRST